jgi:hypothetical protein
MRSSAARGSSQGLGRAVALAGTFAPEFAQENGGTPAAVFPRAKGDCDERRVWRLAVE